MLFVWIDKYLRISFLANSIKLSFLGKFIKKNKIKSKRVKNRIYRPSKKIGLLIKTTKYKKHGFLLWGEKSLIGFAARMKWKCKSLPYFIATKQHELRSDNRRWGYKNN